MPEIKKVILKGGKTRYRTVVDIGYEPKKDAFGNPVVDEATGKPVLKRKQLTITKDKKTEVQDELDRIRGQMVTGTFIAPSDVTVAEWIDTWLDLKARDVEETTLDTYRKLFIHTREKLGHVRLQALTEDDVQAFIDSLIVSGRRRAGKAGTGLAVSTVDAILARLRECLSRAVVRKLIAANPAQFVKISHQAKKRDRKERRRAKPWNVAEVQAFIRGIEGDRLYAPMLLSLMGLRPAEVCGLRWSDIDLKLGTLETANTRTMIRNHTVVEKDTKTEAGDRALPLPTKGAEALKKFRARQAAEKLAAGEAYTDSGYVIVDALGEPLNTRQLREHAYRLMSQLGIRRVRLYDARHSCLTYLAVSGVPDVVLARWAGHTNASFTKAKYVHPDVEDLRPAAAAWDSFHSADSDGV
ncbi:site-specific integrase [Streptomyces cylindrosporus]|uniref:Site-specific integrase n=1 Tax=Streptomyces cylindrosporus TaxID=2927583 RepID=A0ABS9Y2L7_9ACTN|nr:site-specific integrase [Streptomyces cylindrosporus]MCI3271443.1 site-specific integrase [Streptomyces cylindrosporus]